MEAVLVCSSALNRCPGAASVAAAAGPTDALDPAPPQTRWSAPPVRISLLIEHLQLTNGPGSARAVNHLLLPPDVELAQTEEDVPDLEKPMAR